MKSFFEKWKELFNSEKVKEDVEKDLLLAQKYGISSIPSLVINKNKIISGVISLNQIEEVLNNI